LAYVFAPLVGGLAAGLFEELHNYAIAKVAKSAAD
jgi:hypothetical protein